MEFSLFSFLSQHFPPINFNVTVYQRKKMQMILNGACIYFSLFVLFLDFFFSNMESSVHPRQQRESTKY